MSLFIGWQVNYAAGKRFYAAGSRWTKRRNKVHFRCHFEGKILIVHKNVDNHIQNFHLGRYIVGYTFGNHVLRLRLRVAVKLNFRPYIRRYTSPNENFEYSYPLTHCTLACEPMGRFGPNVHIHIVGMGGGGTGGGE